MSEISGEYAQNRIYSWDSFLLTTLQPAAKVCGFLALKINKRYRISKIEKRINLTKDAVAYGLNTDS